MLTNIPNLKVCMELMLPLKIAILRGEPLLSLGQFGCVSFVGGWVKLFIVIKICTLFVFFP
jgi:hypothetical protein